jgi:hypothetical protein
MADVMVSGRNSEIVLSQRALWSLLELLNPNPDDAGPVGPGGPVLAGILGRIEQVLLNPQPLPPKERAVVAARVMIAQSVSTYEMAEAVAADGGERALQLIDARISRLLDEDLCPRPPKPPRPWPHPWGDVLGGSDPIQPAEMLAASVQFQKAADAYEGLALHAPFLSAAEQLREAGLKGLAQA